MLATEPPPTWGAARLAPDGDAFAAGNTVFGRLQAFWSYDWGTVAGVTYNNLVGATTAVWTNKEATTACRCIPVPHYG